MPGHGVIFYFVPVFALCIAVEMAVLMRAHPLYFSWQDLRTNLTMGLGHLILGVLWGWLNYQMFLFVAAYRVFDVPRTVLWYAMFVLLEDFCYYFFHRASHESRLWWASHETHHSSNYFNLSTAVRQTWTGGPHTAIFWLPLAWLGFPVEWIFLQWSVSLAFQFFVHTQCIKNWGIFDLVLNSPSHHRVHHGSNIVYLDRNYAGIFIIWDKLFKTYVPEGLPARYGIGSKSLKSSAPWFIALHVWGELAHDLWLAPTWQARLGYVFNPPGWHPDGKGLTVKKLQQNYAKRHSAGASG